MENPIKQFVLAGLFILLLISIFMLFCIVIMEKSYKKDAILTILMLDSIGLIILILTELSFK